MEKITNHTKYLKEHPYPNLYIEKKRRRFIFSKKCLGMDFQLRIPFRKIKTVSDFDQMCSNWQSEYSKIVTNHYESHDLTLVKTEITITTTLKNHTETDSIIKK